MYFTLTLLYRIVTRQFSWYFISLGLEKCIIIYKKYLAIFRDLLKIGIIECLPNKIFILIYSSIFLKFFRLKKYKEPHFLRKKYLIRDSNINYFFGLNKLKDQVNEYNKSRNSQKLQTIIENKSGGQRKKALIVIPSGWLNLETAEGRTQGPQIQFLIKGLIDIGFEISTFDVIKRNCDFTSLENKLENYDVIFIWSLTIISPDDEFFEYLRFYSKSQALKSKLVGVITASPSESRLKKYSQWKSILDKVVYYEVVSEFKFQLEKLFKTIHLPYIQLHSVDTALLSEFAASVHVSCLLKYNRVAWLLTLRYQCLAIGIKYHIRTMSIPLAEKKLRELYLPSEIISEQRAKYGFGFIMVHRNHNDDAHLIGSFWDYYRLGVIPIIQMQEIKPIAPYMTPYLDYFPVKSELDLYAVLSLGKNYPEYFEELRKRILKRMSTEFSPAIVINKLLSDLNISL